MGMSMSTWIDLLGKSQDDPHVQAALAAAGVKKVPKPSGGSAIFELKGHHLWLVMTKAFHSKRPMTLTSVEAVLSHRKKPGGYLGPLPLGLAANMSQDAIRRVLGTPLTIVDDVPADIWLRDGIEVNVTYTQDLILQTLALTLPADD